MSRHQPSGAGGGAPGSKRSPHTIRFLDSKWRQIVEKAEAQGVTSAEFMRYATLSVMDQGDMSMADLAELIKRTYRATYILASITRDEMIAAGEQERLDELVQIARRLQEDVLGGDRELLDFALDSIPGKARF